MAKTYDISLNTIIDDHPEGWGRFLATKMGLVATEIEIEVEDTKLSIESHCDKLFRVTEPEPSLIHLESQSWSQLGLPKKMHHYNTNADMKHDLPVKSVLLLLRKEAVASDMTGVYIRHDTQGQEIVRFRYDVLKL